MKKIVLLALSLVIALVYYISIYDNISEGVVRLHIISNSNSSEDTKIKLDVRDYILKEMNGRLKKGAEKEDVIELIPEMERLAGEYLKKEKIPYLASATYEKAIIPEKEYNGIVLPEGEYDAIKIILGDGKGENWWCVAYPPLCFTEEVFGGLTKEGEDALEDMVGEEGYRVISSDIRYELKIVEISKKIYKKFIG